MSSELKIRRSAIKKNDIPQIPHLAHFSDFITAECSLKTYIKNCLVVGFVVEGKARHIILTMKSGDWDILTKITIHCDVFNRNISDLVQLSETEDGKAAILVGGNNKAARYTSPITFKFNSVESAEGLQEPLKHLKGIISEARKVQIYI